MPKLDSSQRTFCEAAPGHIRLLAPAGCGKTLSLAHRCVHLHRKASGKSTRFLIVTFTVAAKHELMSRINDDDDFRAIRDVVEVSTLNAWGYRRVKSIAFNPKLITSKADKHFAMLNQLQPVWKKYAHVRFAIEEKKTTTPRKLMELMDELKSLGFDHHEHQKKDEFAAKVDALRKEGLGFKLDDIANRLAALSVLERKVTKAGKEMASTDVEDLYKRFFKFWCDAADHLISNDTFTLEDQKYVAYLDEKQKLDDGKFLSGAARYDHILVDEFQDINPLDLALIRAMTLRNKSTLTIVGDDDQAIFEWRGATPDYIVSPDKYFEHSFETFTLQTNYRSPANIVDLSQKLVRCNTRRVDKKIRAKDTATDAYIKVTATDKLAEGMDLVHVEVQRTLNSRGRMAIIGRKRSQIIPYQLYFASKNISFCAAEDLQLFLSDTFERLLRLIVIKNRCRTKQIRTDAVNDTIELCHLVKRYPLSKPDNEALKRHLNEARPSTVVEGAEALRNYAGPLKNANAQGKISNAMADAIAAFADANSVAGILWTLSVLFEGLQYDLGKAEDDIFFVDPPFLHLAEYAIAYDDDYVRFVEDLELAKDQLAYVPPIDEDGKGTDPGIWKRPVHLMTALRAKGKEFDSVVLLDCNEGIWPNKNAQTPQELEAERRVFYVAFTRAKKRLLMLVNRTMGGKTATPSRFLNDLGLSPK